MNLSELKYLYRKRPAVGSQFPLNLAVTPFHMKTLRHYKSFHVHVRTRNANGEFLDKNSSNTVIGQQQQQPSSSSPPSSHSQTIKQEFNSAKSFPSSTSKEESESKQTSTSSTVRIIGIAIGAAVAVYTWGVSTSSAEANQKNNNNHTLFKGNEDIQSLPLTYVDEHQLDQIGYLRKYPGIYLWGNNAKGIIDPTSSTHSNFKIQNANRIVLPESPNIRDLSIADNHAAAIDQHGNLYQWGMGFSSEPHSPVKTLSSKNLCQVTTTPSHVFTLSKNGDIFMVPSSRREKEMNIPSTPSGLFGWIWGKKHEDDSIKITLENRRWGEKAISIASGDSHVCILTSSQRAFMLSTTPNANSQGQHENGTGDVTKSLRENNQDVNSTFNQIAEEIKELNSIKIKQIACGQNHTLALTKEGDVWGWGSNLYGQLATSANGIGASHPLAIPFPQQLNSLWSRTIPNPVRPSDMQCTNIAAGGNVSLFVVEKDDTNVPGGKDVEVLAVGNGQSGQMGVGIYDLVRTSPITIPSLSHLVEYKENSPSDPVPIYPAKMSVSNTHCSVILNNDTFGGRYGRDVLIWGTNRSGECGRAKIGGFCKVGTPLSFIPSHSQYDTNQMEGRLQIPYDESISGIKGDVICGNGVTAVFTRTR